MPTDPRPGDVLADYRLERVIGHGGGSVVYEALHLPTRRTVALKVLAPHLTADDGFRARFLHESRAAGQLDHEGVVRAFDAGEADGLLYLAMRLVRGPDLGRVLTVEPSLDPWRTLHLLSQVGDALDAAHRAGLVHRDVKPGNILLESEGDRERAYLADFGIVRRLETVADLTRTGQFVGTVDFVAPEQIEGGPVDGRADQYALAAVLFRCLAGEPPFPRSSDVATIYAHLHDPPPGLRLDGEPWLDEVLARGLAKTPDDRFADCTGLMEAVRVQLSNRGPTDAGGGPSWRLATGPNSAVASTRVMPGKRRRWARVAVALVVTVASVATLASVLTNSAGFVPELPGRSSDPLATPTLSPISLVWQLVDSGTAHLGGAGGDGVVDAALTANGYVAVGHTTEAGDEDAAVWTSPDGRAWTRVGRRLLAEPSYQRMEAVTSFGGGLVAVGWHLASGGNLEAAVWRAPVADGPWRRAATLAETGDQVMYDVIADGDRLLAVGRTETDGAVWTSTDGSGWERVRAPDLEGAGTQVLRAVARAPSGPIAVGEATSATDDLDAAVWSESGAGWSRADAGLFARPGDQSLRSVTSQRGATVAAGFDGDRGLVWTRGATGPWQPARAPSPDPDHEELHAVAALGDGFVAGGWRRSEGRIDATIWYSADGRTWTRPPMDEPPTADLGGSGRQEIRAVVPSVGLEYEVLAFGIAGGGLSEQAAVWAGFPIGG